MAKSKSKPGKNGKKNHQPIQEKTVVKKKSGCLPLLILLLAVIALAIWLMSHFNIGFFGKNGDGDNGKSSSGADYSNMVVNDRKPAETTESTENQDNGKKIVDITVCGNQYYYNDGKTEINDFIDEIRTMDGQIFVYITDDNAYADDMTKLKDALTKADIPYIEPTDNNN